jgi:hypothetical protein
MIKYQSIAKRRNKLMKFKALLSVVTTILFIAIISENAIANSNVSEPPFTNIRWSDERIGVALFDKPDSFAEETVSITVYKDGDKVDSYSFEDTDNYDVRVAINGSGIYTFTVSDVFDGKLSESSAPLEYKKPGTQMQTPKNVRWILNDEEMPYPIWDWPDDTTQFYVEIIYPVQESINIENLHTYCTR